VTWPFFERAAERYEDWYETPSGRRASRAETALLAWLLAGFPGAQTALEVGCGTGHFTARLAQHGLRPIGLDRAPAMLAVLRRRHPALPVLLADAEALPLRDHAVDLVVFVATLEFLADARRALAEAVRVARRGVVAVALNRWSAGGLSRRIGPASRGSLLRQARDLSQPELRRLVAEAAGPRLARLRQRGALLPRPLPAGPTRAPFGDVVGVAAELRSVGR
jgi:ubiquinone/menaquinone biosynthesis C-methylase UbiE